jgi:hypothetical protein
MSKYQEFDPMDPLTYEALKADIAARGVLVPIERDEQGNTLDGHHREKICVELGIKEYPVTIRAGLTEEEKYEHLQKLNSLRRHMTAKQFDSQLEKLVQQAANWSNRRIADVVGVSHHTVGAVREKLEQLGIIAQLDKTVGADGRSRPAQRAPKTIIATSPQQADAAVKCLEISGWETGKGDTTTAGEVIHEANKTLYASNANRLAPMMTSDSFEWYTPPHIMERIHSLLGNIDIDPCTSIAANAVVKAAEICTAEDSGLLKEWHGRVYMNPPYGDVIGEWARKLVEEFYAGRTTQAVALLPARTDTTWFRALREYPRCFLHGRLKFGGPGENGNSATFPSVVVALGVEAELLADVFEGLGDTYAAVRGGADRA